MISEQERLAFEMKGTLLFDQKSYTALNQRIPVDTISFRFSANSIIENNGEALKLSDNSICFAPANSLFSGHLKNDKRIVIHFKLFNYTSDVVQVYTPSNPEKFAGLFGQAYECDRKKEVGYHHKTAAILNLIFAELYAENCSLKESNSKISNSIKYINQNLYSSSLSLSVAAKKSFISETYFRRLFKREFGVAPKEYIIRKRIEYATSLIISSNCSLKEVAVLSGYKDYNLFFTEFKRLTGQIPSKYSYSSAYRPTD